jgi:hypothetical protein
MSFVKRNINTLEYPMWVPSTLNSKKIESNKYLIYTNNLHLPHSKDIQILNMLLQMSQKKASNYIEIGNTYKFLTSLGFTKSNFNYKRLKLSLDIWHTTFIRYKESFYSDGKLYTTPDIGIIKNKFLSNKNSFIELNERFLDIHKEKFALEIPLKIFNGIKSPTAKRLFEILSKSFIKKNTLGEFLPFYIKFDILRNKIPIGDKAGNVRFNNRISHYTNEINNSLCLFNAKRRFSYSSKNSVAYFTLKQK